MGTSFDHRHLMTMMVGHASASIRDDAEAAHRREGCRAADLDVIEQLAVRAPIDRVLEAVCHVVECALGDASAIVIVSDDRCGHRAVAGPELSDRVVEAVTARVESELLGLDAARASPDRAAIVRLPGESHRTVWCVPIDGLRATPLGAICVTRPSCRTPAERERRVVRHAANLAQLAIEQHLAERLVFELIAAERRQVAKDLHDDPVQAMTVVSLLLQRMAIEATAEQGEMLRQIRGTVDRAIDRMRRMLFELHPTTLDDEGLAVAVEVCLEETFDPLGVEWQIDDSLHDAPDDHTAAVAYRLIHEALANVAAHAAPSMVRVELGNRDGGMTVRIFDDGCGFDPDSLPRNRPGHLGLHTAHELVKRASGRLDIRSAPGAGCTVELWLPDPPTSR